MYTIEQNLTCVHQSTYGRNITTVQEADGKFYVNAHKISILSWIWSVIVSLNYGSVWTVDILISGGTAEYNVFCIYANIFLTMH